MYKFILAVLLVAALPAAADARYHGGSHVSIGVGIGGGYYGGGYGYGYAPYYAPYPYYPPAYSYYPPVYSAPAPVIVESGSPYNNYARPTASRGDQGYCREYTRNVRINGRTQQTYGTACQQPDGTWQEVN